MKIIRGFLSWLRDPFHIDRDWDRYESMTDEQLRSEFRELLGEDRYSQINRLSQFIAVRWVTKTESKHE